MKESGVDGVTYVLWRCAEGVRKQGVIHVFDPIKSVKSTNTMITRYTHVKSKAGASTLASLRYARIMTGTRSDASKITIQAHELIGSLTLCEDAQKESEKKE